MQNHALAAEFIEHLFELFGDESVSWDAARSVGNVVAPSNILVKRNHAVIKVGFLPDCYLRSHSDRKTGFTCAEVCESSTPTIDRWREGHLW